MIRKQICSKCFLEKSMENFEWRKDQQKYRMNCRQCTNEVKNKIEVSEEVKIYRNIKNKEYCERNKQKVAETRKLYYEKNKDSLKQWQKDHRENNPKKYILVKTKTRAKQKNLDFNLSEEDIPEIPEYCTAGDLIAETQQCDGFFRKTDGTGVIQSIVVVDEADQKAVLDIYFLSSNVSMGSENSAPSISDADANHVLGCVSVAATDYKDLGGVSVATIKNIGLPVKAVSGTDDIYVAVVNGTGAPDYVNADDLILRIGALLD